jgi:hypothetical protein
MNGRKRQERAVNIVRSVAIIMVFLGFQPLLMSPKVMGGSEPKVSVSSRNIPQGDLGLIRVEVGKGEIPQVTWMGEKVHMVPNDQERTWRGFLGVDLKAKPGTYPLYVEILPAGGEKNTEIHVEQKRYGVRRLTLPREMVALDAPTLERVKEEARTMRALWEAPASIAAWSGPFLRPVEGEVVGPFGRSSIINEQPRTPHSGVDLRADRGTPIKAINDGRVALTCDHFFSGRSVVIDHGGGILSMYFHLEKILVQKDEKVTKGQVVGLVGSTGRATGPHLHFGIRVNGARVDPLRLVSLSEDLE